MAVTLKGIQRLWNQLGEEPVRNGKADDSIGELIREVRGGSSEALGELLQRYRNYLLHVARSDLDSDLLAKGGASDLVQESFVDAQRDFDRFHGDCRGSLKNWLREILQHNKVDFIRRYRAAARQTTREKPLVQMSSDVLAADFELDSLGPAERAEAEEQRILLQAAIEKLPDHYRQVLLLRHAEGADWAETATQMDRSVDAVQKLWMRALVRLRQQLGG